MIQTASPRGINQHLPPHLREVCDVLARGMLRLRSRTAQDLARETGDSGEFRLHLTARQRRHANPNREGRA